MKPKIAIFDLTDCEGCELQFLSLKEKLLLLWEEFEVTNWRLVQADGLPSQQIDYALVEGTVITPEDRDLLIEIRKRAKNLVAFGECARTGWIPAWINKKDRERLTRYVYGEKYSPKAFDALPLSRFVKVDFNLPGCPVDLKVLENFLESIYEKNHS